MLSIHFTFTKTLKLYYHNMQAKQFKFSTSGHNNNFTFTHTFFFFLTRAPLQQTGVHLFVSFTLTLKYPDTWVQRVRGRSTAPWEPIARQHCAVRGWGGGGVADSLLESHRRILCETETRRLTETPHSCETTDKQHSPSFQTRSLCLRTHFSLLSISLTSSPAESTRSKWPPRHRGTDVFLLDDAFADKCVIPLYTIVG